LTTEDPRLISHRDRQRARDELAKRHLQIFLYHLRDLEFSPDDWVILDDLCNNLPQSHVALIGKWLAECRELRSEPCSWPDV